MFHSKMDISLKYQEIFGDEPSHKLKTFFSEIGVPFTKLEEILELIKYITSSMKKVLDQLDPWQTHTYLNTSSEFEKIFNLKDPINDKSQFQECKNVFKNNDHSIKAKSQNFGEL